MRKFRFAIIDIILLLFAIVIIPMTISAHDGNDDREATTTIVGDMLLSDDQLSYLYATDEEMRAMEAANPFIPWSNATLFYKFDKSLDQRGRLTVSNAMSYISNVSCVRFVESEEPRHCVLIMRGSGCSSTVGMRRDGLQRMIIDGNLCSKGSVIHELLHSLGFLHMHTTSGRDKYIEINWDNIRDDAKLNFKPFTTHVNMFDTPYDYDSITHYGRFAFAKNKSIPTIIARQSALNIGQRKEMSFGDITRLNRMYNCPNFQEIKSDESEIPNETNASVNNRDDDDMGDGEPESQNDSDEDDMILSKEQIEAMYSLGNAKRNGLAKVFHHWPQGIVPFEIDRNFHPNYVRTIYEAMNHIMNRSCIQFVPRTPYDQNFIYIMPPANPNGGCSSEVGMKRNSGGQSLLINETVCSRGKVIHELLHSLGFFHMHTATDRDNYIRINWDNIREQAKGNFIQMNMHVSMFSTPYDYDSIMHYSSTAFAKNRNKKTIIPLAMANDMGQRRGMSEGDILRLNRMYKCRITTPSTAAAITTTSTNAPDISLEISSTETGVESSNNAKNDKQKPKSLFAMLFLKIVDKN